MPPWPGIIQPESLAPNARLIADSHRAPRAASARAPDRALNRGPPGADERGQHGDREREPDGLLRTEPRKEDQPAEEPDQDGPGEAAEGGLPRRAWGSRG